MKQIVHSIKQLADAEFRSHHLTLPQGMLIGILTKHGEMKISDISKHMKLTNSTVSGIVDRLEKQGYVRRIRDEKDRRVVRVRFENEKCDVMQIEKRIENHLRLSMSQRTEQELSYILSALTLFKNTITQQEQKSEEKTPC
jgi:DNA-binding MarR family transcriptional regulator